MSEPAGRRQAGSSAAEQEGETIASRGIPPTPGRAAVSLRSPSGRRNGPPDAVPRAPSERSEVSPRLRRVRPRAQQLVETHQSVRKGGCGGWRERTTEWHLPDDYIRKPFRSSRSCSSSPSLGTTATRGGKHPPNSKTPTRRENKLECSGGGSGGGSPGRPGGMETAGEKWKGVKVSFAKEKKKGGGL